MAFDFPNSPTVGQAYNRFIWDGEKWILPSTASAAGSNGQVQFNGSGSLFGDAALFWDNTGKQLWASRLSVTNRITASADIYINPSTGTASLFVGSGQAAQQASITFIEPGVGNKWQVGKGADNVFFVYDIGASRAPLAIGPDGDIVFYPVGSILNYHNTAASTSELVESWLWLGDSTNWGLRLFQRHTGSTIVYDLKIRGNSPTDNPAISINSNGHIAFAANGYLNFGSVFDAGGYGLRDNGGAIEFKNSSGAWTALGAGGSGAPGGTSGQVQYNSSGAFAGDAGLLYDSGSRVLGLGFYSGLSQATYRGHIQIESSADINSGVNGIEFKAATAGAGYGWKIAGPDRGSGNAPLVFAFRSSAATWTELVTFRMDTGRVGINTNAPIMTLDVNGDTYLRGATHFGGNLIYYDTGPTARVQLDFEYGNLLYRNVDSGADRWWFALGAGGNNIDMFGGAGNVQVDAKLRLSLGSIQVDNGAIFSRGGSFKDANANVQYGGNQPYISLAAHASLQAAIDSLPVFGGTIYIPAGVWVQVGKVTCSGKGSVNLIGEGPGVSVLQWNNNSTDNGVQITYTGQPGNLYAECSVVSGISFVCGGYGTAAGLGTALRLIWNNVFTSGQTDAVIQNCEFVANVRGHEGSLQYQFWTEGIGLVNARQSFIYGCNFIGDWQTWQVQALGIGIRGYGWTVQTNVRDCSFTELYTGILMGGLCEGIYFSFMPFVNCNYGVYLDGAHPSTNGASSSTVAIGSGSKTFVTQAGLDYWPGMQLTAFGGGGYITGLVTSYSGTTLVMSATSWGGSGSASSWSIATNHYQSDIKLLNGHGNCWSAAIWARQTAFGFMTGWEIQQGGMTTPFYGVRLEAGNVLWTISDCVFTDYTTGTGSAGIIFGGSTSITPNQNICVHDIHCRALDYGIYIASGNNGPTFRVHDIINQGGIAGALLSDQTGTAVVHNIG